MRRWKRSACVPAIAMVGGLLALVGATTAPADAAGCNRTWNPPVNGGDGISWTDGGNWDPAGTPGDDGAVPAASEVACIGGGAHVVASGASNNPFNQLQLTGTAQLDVQGGSTILLNGADSVWAAGTTVTMAPGGVVGGSGTIHVQGSVTFTGGGNPTFLSSNQTTGGGQPPPADPGDMTIEGSATVATKALGLAGGYHVTIAPGASMTVAPGAFVNGDAGTGLAIQPGAVVNLAGDGGLYQAAAVGSLPPTAVVNNGTLVKSAGGGASVVEGTYQGTGQVLAQTGILAMPDGGLVTGKVSPGAGFATGKCEALVPTQVCGPTFNGAVDPMNLVFLVPSTNGAPATVDLQELPAVGAAVDPAAIGNEVLAHATGLVPDTSHPAELQIRYTQADVMATPLDEIRVVHTADNGAQVVVPDCVNGTLPAGLFYCMLRPPDRINGYTVVHVLTVQTSRWHLRRGQAVPSDGTPTAPQGLKVTEPKPFDGSVLKASWAAPASSGAGPVSGYRVSVDGKLRTTTSATSFTVKNPGAGKHTFAVTAVNVLGVSAKVTKKVTLDDLSKPRKVAAKPGPAGGQQTVTVTWKSPDDAGGLTIKRYQVAVLTGSGATIAKKLVSGGTHRLVVKAGGQVRVRVRAKNADGFGPWSKPSAAVRPR